MKRLRILFALTVIAAATVAPDAAAEEIPISSALHSEGRMEAQPCRVRHPHRPIGNKAVRPIRRVPRKQIYGRRATASPRGGAYPYVGPRRTPKGVFLFY